jgi:hypothetical protein
VRLFVRLPVACRVPRAACRCCRRYFRWATDGQVQVVVFKRRGFMLAATHAMLSWILLVFTAFFSPDACLHVSLRWRERRLLQTRAGCEVACVVSWPNSGRALPLLCWHACSTFAAMHRCSAVDS